MRVSRILLLSCLALAGWSVAPAAAQTLGTYRWQFQPYCNVMTVVVTRVGSTYTLDGYDDLCGAAQRASLHGTAFQNPSGTIGFGVTVVYPDGQTAHATTSINPTTLNGTWQDDQGNSGAFQFNPAAPAGTPRPGAGAIRIGVGNGAWGPFNSTDNLQFAYFANLVRVIKPTAGSSFISVHPAMPVVLAGRRLRLVALEFCYSATAAAPLQDISLRTVTNASTTTSGSVARVQDTTTRTDAACRTYPVSPGYVLTSNDVVNVFVAVNFSANSVFDIRRTTIVLEPTSSSAASDEAPVLTETPLTVGGDGPSPDARKPGR